MILSSAQHTVCFDSNRKPNPWWRSSQWSRPSSPVTPSPQLPAGCSTEALRTSKSRFRCRFQLQLSSLTSLCRWTLEWRFLCRVVRGSLRCCEDHSLWPREYINSQPKGLSMGKKVDSLPSASFFPSPFPPSSFLLSLLPSPSFPLSFPPTNGSPPRARHTSRWSVYFFEKDECCSALEIPLGRTNKQTDE